MRKKILFFLMLAMFLLGCAWFYVKEYGVCMAGTCSLEKNYHNVSKALDNPSFEGKIN